MPNYTQKNTATKGNMAAQQKEKKKKYTSQENSDGTTTNTFEKKKKLGKNKGQVKKRVTSIVKKDKSGETKGLASVTQKYDKKGKLKSEKGSGKKKELASLRKSVKNNDSIAAAQQKGARPDYPDIDGDGNKTESMKKAAQDKNSNAAQQRGSINYQKAKLEASKNTNTKPKPKSKSKPPKKNKKEKVEKVAQKKGKAKPTTTTASISKANLMLKPNKDVFKPIKSDTNINIKLMKEPKSPEMAAPMKGYHPGKMSDTDMGIEYRFGKQATADAKAAQQKGNPIIPNLYKDEYTDSGMNYRDANNARIKGTTVDEGHLSNVKTKSPYRPYVETEQTSKVPMRPNSAALPGGGEPGEKLFLDKAAKMHAQHPSKQRMANMVSKVAQYKMPNVKAAQKKYCK